MSRRIENKMEITNKDLAMRALQQAGISYQDMGTEIVMTSGDLANARIDLITGSVRGDSDFGHTSQKFGVLRQYYSEAQVREEYNKSGTMIDGRSVDQDGNVVLDWHFG